MVSCNAAVVQRKWLLYELGAGSLKSWCSWSITRLERPYERNEWTLDSLRGGPLALLGLGRLAQESLFASFQTVK